MQVKELQFIFLSKSIGAIETGIIADKLDVSVKQIFLTPVEDAASYLRSDSIVVIGTNDKAYPFYKEKCEEKQVETLYVEGADHSLEIQNRLFESIQVLEKGDSIYKCNP